MILPFCPNVQSWEREKEGRKNISEKILRPEWHLFALLPTFIAAAGATRTWYTRPMPSPLPSREEKHWFFTDSLGAPSHPWAFRGLVATLFFLCLAHYFFFWKVPDPFYRGFDWGKEFTYFRLIGEAWKTRKIPFHGSEPLRVCNAQGATTDRFLAIPETLSPLSPQAPLLGRLDPKTFVLIDSWLMIAIGMLGLIRLGQMQAWSPAGFSCAVFLWAFNGNQTAHLTVGHSMWLGAFLLPWLAVAFVYADREDTWRSGIPIALVLAVLLLQGAFHLFVMGFILIWTALLFPSRNPRALFLAGILAPFLGAFRLVPAAGTFQPLGFLGGFPDIHTIVKSLLTIVPWNGSRDGLGYLGHWEFDSYVGPLGMLFLVWYGIVRPVRREGLAHAMVNRPLAMPLFIFALLSYSDVYTLLLGNLPFSAFDSQRITSRFILFPLLGLVCSAAGELSRAARSEWQKKDGTSLPTMGRAFAVTMGLMLFFLLSHSFVWSLGPVERCFAASPPSWNQRPVIVERDDGIYREATIGAHVLSGIVLAFSLAVLLLPHRDPGPERKASPSKPHRGRRRKKTGPGLPPE